jgi:hypothetical protein
MKSFEKSGQNFNESNTKLSRVRNAKNMSRKKTFAFRLFKFVDSRVFSM